MQCPNCRSAIPEYHYYCPRCRIPVQDYLREGADRRRDLLGRVLNNLLTLAILSIFVGGSVIVARQIDWREMYRVFFEQPDGSGGRMPAERGKPEPASGRRRGREPEQPGGTTRGSRDISSGGIESVRQLPRPIEELPFPGGGEANPAKTAPRRGLAQPEPGEIVGEIASQEAGDDAYLSIDCYTPARIYIDGQYSGTTPATIRLSAGDHMLRLMADGYDDWTRRIRLRSRQQTGLTASLKKSRD